MARKRILVVSPGEWDEEALARPAVSLTYEIVRESAELALDPSRFHGERFDLERWLRTRVELHRHARFDGVVGTGDYPGCQLAALLARELELPSPRFEDVVRLSHKLHSREIHARCVPEATPRFVAFDPWAPRRAPPLLFPFFTKPVKGTMSIRARLVRNEAELDAVLAFTEQQRAEREELLAPFDQMLRAAGCEVPAHWFIAESNLAGEQVTVDGFVERGRVTIQGIVDSVMYPGTRSFERFDLPSRLPETTQRRMRDVVTRLVEGSGLDQCCFNVELMHEATTGAISVIEINPRMSYQFADLYEHVDGLSTFDAQLARAIGQPVRWTPRAGRYGAASSFALRRFTDARVRSVPSAATIARAREQVPSLQARILCAAGERLSDHDQDTESFRYAIINLAAANERALEADWTAVQRLLAFQFDDA
jgi:hypothetical protein